MLIREVNGLSQKLMMSSHLTTLNLVCPENAVLQHLAKGIPLTTDVQIGWAPMMMEMLWIVDMTVWMNSIGSQSLVLVCKEKVMMMLVFRQTILVSWIPDLRHKRLDFLPYSGRPVAPEQESCCRDWVHLLVLYPVHLHHLRRLRDHCPLSDLTDVP